MKLVSISLFLALLFWSCDTVPYQDAYEAQPPVIVDTTKNDSNALDYTQKVFLEDYTGHTCGNCPFAAEEAKRLEERYQGKVIVMAIHCGFFARPNLNPSSNKFKADFRTPVGDALDNQFGPSAAGLPKGIIQRKAFDGQTNISLLSSSVWDGKILEVINQPSNEIGIRLKASLSGNSVSLTTDVAFRKSYSGKIKQAVYLVEDSIVSWQKFYPSPGVTEEIEKYVHMHMLRGTLNPSNGVSFLSDQAEYQSGDSFSKVWSGPIPNLNPAIKVKNAKLVYVLYRDENWEVLQVGETKIPLS
jgi:hypothetical protein